MTTKALNMNIAQPVFKEGSSTPGWTGIYRAGAIAALVAVLAGLLDTLIMFVPNTGFVPGERTVVDWFAVYNSQPLLALRDMGILNILTTFSTVFVFFALFGAHRRANPAAAALALIVLCIGTTVYIANNMALPMLSLSQQYAAATSESQRAMLVSAGQVLLAQEDIGAGSFIGFFIPEVAGVIMALVMLRGRIFSRWAGWTGLLGESSLILFNILAAFVPGLFELSMLFAMLGGPLAMVWLTLTAIGLLRTARAE